MADIAGAGKLTKKLPREDRAKKKKTQNKTTMMMNEKQKILTEPKVLKKTIPLGESPEVLQDSLHDPAEARKL